MLEEHGVVDKAGGSRMPMKAVLPLDFDKALVDAIGEFEVKAHGVVGVLWVVLGERLKITPSAE
jgi:hypothetical protein